jgi:hypothetical protein
MDSGIKLGGQQPPDRCLGGLKPTLQNRRCAPTALLGQPAEWASVHQSNVLPKLASLNTARHEDRRVGFSPPMNTPESSEATALKNIASEHCVNVAA